MKKSFLTMAVLAFITLGFVACGGVKSPIEVELYEEKPYANYMPYTVVKVRAVVDSVTIQKIIINRGNCEQIGYGVNTTIKFGEVTIDKTSCSTRDVKEVQVVTDKGTWTFNF